MSKRLWIQSLKICTLEMYYVIKKLYVYCEYVIEIKYPQLYVYQKNKNYNKKKMEYL